MVVEAGMIESLFLIVRILKCAFTLGVRDFSGESHNIMFSHLGILKTYLP
jgi:hypothetical protein